MNYDEWLPMPNNYIRKGTSAYNNERELYEVLHMESFNHMGVQLVYYPVSISADKLFGEDNSRVVERRFDFMARYDLPNESRNVSTIGIAGLDNFPIYISIMHFDFVSRFDSFGTSGAYETYTPKIGDLIYAKYNKTFYNILNVKAEENIFLQGKHTYTFILDVYKNKNYLYSDEIKKANLLGTDQMLTILYGNSSITTTKDIFDITDVINKEKVNIEYKQAYDECNPKDPFNDWWSDK